MRLEIMIVILGSLLWIWALAGCAGPEPYRPIDRYRVIYFGQ